MQRHYLGLTAAVAALGMAATLSGCGTGSAAGDVTLKLVAADYGDSAANSSKKYWDELARNFEASHPGIKVDVNVYSWKDVDRKVAEMVEERAGPRHRADRCLRRLRQAGQALQRRRHARHPHAGRTSCRGSPTRARYNQTQYGLPFVASTRLLFYNKKLLQPGGPGPPRRPGTTSVTTPRCSSSVASPTRSRCRSGPEESQAETMMWLLSGGGGYTDDVGSYDIDSAENVKTFDWLKDEPGRQGADRPGRPRQSSTGRRRSTRSRAARSGCSTGTPR